MTGWTLALVLVALLTQAVPTQPPRAPLHPISSSIAPAETALVGTIDRFEPSERQLTLATRQGRITVFVAAAAVVRMGSKRLSTADIGTHRGRQAKVRYTERDGRRTAHWIVISSESPHAAG